MQQRHLDVRHSADYGPDSDRPPAYKRATRESFLIWTLISTSYIQRESQQGQGWETGWGTCDCPSKTKTYGRCHQWLKWIHGFTVWKPPPMSGQCVIYRVSVLGLGCNWTTFCTLTCYTLTRHWYYFRRPWNHVSYWDSLQCIAHAFPHLKYPRPWRRGPL